jgi:hypothetical protein
MSLFAGLLLHRQDRYSSYRKSLLTMPPTKPNSMSLRNGRADYKSNDVHSSMAVSNESLITHHQHSWMKHILVACVVLFSMFSSAVLVLRVGTSQSTSSILIPSTTEMTRRILTTTTTTTTIITPSPHEDYSTELLFKNSSIVTGQEVDADIVHILHSLNRIGISNVCHPTSDYYAPTIPLCPSTGHNSNNNTEDGHYTHQRDGRTLYEGKRVDVDDEVRINNENEIIFLILNIVACIVCIMAVALMSCMFLGFMTLDPLDLRIQIRASVDAEVRDRASMLLPIVEQNHRLLVTLLLAEALFYESMPLLMDNLLPSWAAILMSVTVLLVFGEIIPSAFVTGPEQLRWASRLTPLMNFLLWFLHPVAAPLTWMLDTMVPPGEAEDEFYDRGELSALIKIQFEDRQKENKRIGAAGGLTPHSRTLRGSVVSPGVIGNNLSVTVAEKSRGWRNLKREIMEEVEHRRVEQLNQLQQQLHQQKQQPNHHHHNHHQNAPSSPGTSTSVASGMGVGPGGAFHHQYHNSNNSGGDYGTGGGTGTVGGGGSHRRQHRAMSIGSDNESVHSYSTPPAYEQIAPPLHQAEMNVLEGALTMKTKVRGGNDCIIMYNHFV